MEDVDLVLVLPMPMRLADWASKARFPLEHQPPKRNKHHKRPHRDSKELPRRPSLPHHVKVMMVVSQVVVDSILVDVPVLLLH
jgi:hypothetical protein